MILKPFEIFASLGIALTAILGFYNLVINLKSQRKTHRELVFTKQFDFFMQLQGLIAKFEDAVSNINEQIPTIQESRELIFKISNDMDDLISENELIIPESLYEMISDYVASCHKITSLSYIKPAKIDDAYKIDFVSKNVKLMIELSDYLGIERLGDENRELVRKAAWRSKS